MIRLDRFLCERNAGSRSCIKEILKAGRVTLNDEVMKDGSRKLDEQKDRVCLDGVLLPVSRFRYFMLNKPAGVVTATKDNLSPTVLDLLKEEGKKDLFPAGRLDKDTEGLLLITNDGALAHKLLSPGKHVSKTYYVKTENRVTEAAAEALRKGVDIGDEKITLPAEVKITGEREMLLTITEGRFHQVKRMLSAVKNKVVFLKRIRMGNLELDSDLEPGAYRILTETEIKALKEPDKNYDFG